MNRKLPMFEPAPAAGRNEHPRPELPIVPDGGAAGLPAADGSVAARPHPDWIRARMPPPVLALGPHISVNGICLGRIRTDMLEEVDPAVHERILAETAR